MSVLALDAFMAVENTSGHSRGRLSCDDWIQGRHAVCDHGFVAFADLRDPNVSIESLVELFNRIDSAGSGTIQLKDWIRFIEETEIKAGTFMGLFISIDSGAVLDGDGDRRNISGS